MHPVKCRGLLCIQLYKCSLTWSVPLRVFSALDFPPGLMDLPYLKANQTEAKPAWRILVLSHPILFPGCLCCRPWSVSVSVCVFTRRLLSKQTSLSFVLISQTSFSCSWLRMSASCPSEPAIQFQGKFSLGENKDSSTHFSLGF